MANKKTEAGPGDRPEPDAGGPAAGGIGPQDPAALAATPDPDRIAPAAEAPDAAPVTDAAPATDTAPATAAPAGAPEPAGRRRGPFDRTDEPEAAAEARPEPEPEPAYGVAPGLRDEPAEAHDEDAAEEERGRSFAARALTFLVLLLAGAALGIWAAPRVAPHLPAGLAPVAAWLTPGAAQSEARVAALEARLQDDLAALGGRVDALPDAAAVEEAAAGAADAARADATSQIEALRQEVDQVAAEAGAGDDVGERIGALETAVAGATAELATLRDQIESGAAGLSEDAQAGIDTYRAELEGMRAEVERLSSAVSGLGGRVDAAETEFQSRASAVEAEAAEAQATAAAERDLAAASAHVAAIRAALVSGESFEEPLGRLAAETPVPAALAEAAPSGAPTMAALRASFTDAAHEAIRESIQAGAGEGIVARSRAFLESQVASRSLTPREGQAPDAILSRMEDALRRDDLETALAEAEALPSEAAAALSGWLEAARLRANAEAGLATLDASVSTTN